MFSVHQVAEIKFKFLFKNDNCAYKTRRAIRCLEKASCEGQITQSGDRFLLPAVRSTYWRNELCHYIKQKKKEKSLSKFVRMTGMNMKAFFPRSQLRSPFQHYKCMRFLHKIKEARFAGKWVSS